MVSLQILVKKKLRFWHLIIIADSEHHCFALLKHARLKSVYRIVKFGQGKECHICKAPHYIRKTFRLFPSQNYS